MKINVIILIFLSGFRKCQPLHLIQGVNYFTKIRRSVNILTAGVKELPHYPI